jgi:hypothetical protein
MYYTYIHYKAGTRIPFYVGKGKGDRLFITRGRNAYWERTFSKHGRDAEVLAYWDSEEEAYEHEKLIIGSLKDLGYNLCNLTDGGDNPPINLQHSEETKRKIAESVSGCRNYNYLRTGLLASNLRYITKATNVETGEVKFLVGTAEMKKAGFGHGRITACFKGETKQYKGHTFEKIDLAGLQFRN